MRALILLRWLMEEEQKWKNTQFTTTRYKEAIKELEALEKKCCDTCKWEEIDSNEPPCNECSVGYSCCWEEKQ